MSSYHCHKLSQLIINVSCFNKLRFPERSQIQRQFYRNVKFSCLAYTFSVRVNIVTKTVQHNFTRRTQTSSDRPPVSAVHLPNIHTISTINGIILSGG